MNMIEVLKQMVEALREDRAWLESDAPKEVWDKNNDAISAGRQAIAELEQKKLAELEEVMIEVWKPVPEKLKIEKTILKDLFPALKSKMSGDKS
jgi:hypothetical protein